VTGVIEVRNLRREFGDLTAVDGVSFDVREGEIFGFLGPNGAGKTTTIHMLCTLLKPGGGSARVAGHDIRESPDAVRQSIGMVFQEPSLDDQLTARENMRFHAMLYNMERSDFQKRSDQLLALVELADRADELVRNFSGGMKRRLEVARGLLHRPQVLFLDEPTLGLDPQTRRHIWQYLRELRDREKVTIFMTTHYMDEAENCDRVAIMDRGQLVAMDDPDALKGLVGGDLVSAWTSDNEAAMRHLNRVDGHESRLGPQGEVILEVDAGDSFIPKLMQILNSAENPVQVHSVNLRRPTLEDVFVKLTGHAIREAEASATERMSMRMRARRGR
jgi:ABC-2 type transport system ATP-binding protein